jgi:hypothetical protein
MQLITVAVTRPRGRSLETALDDLSRLAAKRRSRLVAEVRVATPLDPTQEQRLGAALARVYGREVALQVDVDPSVLGGIRGQGRRRGPRRHDRAPAGHRPPRPRRLTHPPHGTRPHHPPPRDTESRDESR